MTIPLASIAFRRAACVLSASVGLPFPLSWAAVRKAVAVRFAAVLLPACVLSAACVHALSACVSVRHAVLRALSPFVPFFRSVVSNRPLQGLQGAG
jgi:hypothetical protein